MMAHVISIKGSSRREKAIERAKDYGLNLNFFDAINLTKMDNKNLKDFFNIEKFIARYSRQPSSGDIGCSMSHYALWKKLSIDSESPFHLILEDDFIPKVNASEILKIVMETNKNFDVLILGYSKVQEKEESVIKIINPLKALYSTGRHKIGVKFRESSCGAVAYVVSKNFVDQVSQFSQKPSYVLDDWVFFKQSGFSILHVQPLCFYEDFLNMKSYITESGRHIPMHDDIKIKKSAVYIFCRLIYRYIYGRVLALLMFFNIYSSY